jgi:predicted deacylase
VADPTPLVLTSAQEEWDLPHPGSCGSTQCTQWIVRVTNERTLPYAHRPEVFLSGALHGNERIGPNTVTELLLLLVKNRVEAEACAASDRVCDEDAFNPWLAHLVDTRALFVMPMTNAYGYAHDVRHEKSDKPNHNRVDPNRDFAYGQAPSQCMQTVAARAVNELWRRHLFQLAITFHGGMVAIAYEWGDMAHRTNTESPDDRAQAWLTDSMCDFGGGDYYTADRLTDIVNPVPGGMEGE